MALTPLATASSSVGFASCSLSVIGALQDGRKSVVGDVLTKRTVLTAATVLGVTAAVAVAPTGRRRSGCGRAGPRTSRRCEAQSLCEAQRALLEAQFRMPLKEESLAEPTGLVVPTDALTVVDMEAQLHAAVAAERFEEAARLRDAIHQRSEAAEAAVLAANRKFFDAWASRDIERMRDLWYDGHRSCCIHASSKPVHGYPAVVESWAGAFQTSRSTKDAKYSDHSVAISDNVGRVVCCQTFSNGEIIAITNHFERTRAGWKLVCHQDTVVKAPKQGPGVASLLSNVPEWFCRKWKQHREETVRRQKENARKKEEERQWQLASLSRRLATVDSC